MIFLVAFLASVVALASEPLVAHVDPFIGTQMHVDDKLMWGGAGGNTSPSATLPFGMVQVGPDTESQQSASFEFTRNSILGFSLTHLSGAGCLNSGELRILPVADVKKIPADLPLKRERGTNAPGSARPGFYSVQLENGVKAEMTATLRTGMLQFHFPAQSAISIDVGKTGAGDTVGFIHQTKERQLSGWVKGSTFCEAQDSYKLYFTIVTSADFQLSSLSASRSLLVFASPPHPGEQQKVIIKVGLSYVSEDGAADNLQKENPAWNFNAIRSAAERKWEKALARVLVSGPNHEHKKMFYTALYHSLLHPNIASDVTGNYLGYDGAVHSSHLHRHYANFSGWDMYRTQSQLLAWLFPKEASDMAQSLIADADQCGSLPEWGRNNNETGVMVGDPGAVILANFDAFGATDFDHVAALKYMKLSSFDPTTKCQSHIARPGLKEYMALGYVPDDLKGVWGPTATTLEYSVADAAVSEFARRHGDGTSADALAHRAQSWQNLFNPLSSYIQPKTSSGNWLEPFRVDSRDHYVEGSAAQYLWMVPHDSKSLIRLVGGDKTAVARLDEHFHDINSGPDSSHLYIGNEPGFGAPWIYLWAGAPSRTQALVRRIQNEAFSTGPDGLPGNDDLGATSAWFVWSALGMYPALPGRGDVVLHSPLFRDVVIKGGSGTLKIRAAKAPMPYVQELLLNGKKHSRTWLTPQQRNSGELIFEMGQLPSHWGEGETPPSL